MKKLNLKNSVAAAARSAAMEAENHVKHRRISLDAMKRVFVLIAVIINILCSNNELRAQMNDPEKLQNYGFLGYTGDTRSRAGITFGTLKQEKTGWYFSMKMTPKFLDYLFTKSSEKYEIKWTEPIPRVNPHVPPGLRVTGADAIIFSNLEDKSRIINFNSTFGITRKLYYPVWFHVGVGVSWDNVIRLNNDYSPGSGAPGSFIIGGFNPDGSDLVIAMGSKHTTKTKYVKYADRASVSPMLDCGLFLTVGRFAFNGGFLLSTNKDFRFTFGSQFTFKK